jgi:ankyrin repeat protein/beta-lactamase regulating signal transducer with metallopeptidase domain
MDLALLLKISVALTIGLGAAALTRRARASVRHLILATTFAALLVIPASSRLIPGVAVPVKRPPVTLATVIPDIETRNAVSRVAHSAAAILPTSAASATKERSLLVGAWAAGALFLLGRLGFALLRLRQLRRTAIPWVDGQALLNRVSADTGLPGVDVLRHDALGAPVTWGVRSPIVLMPQEADTWSEQDLRQAFLHELEHIHRRDWIVQVLARAAVAIYWFHPLVWIAWRQLCLESERACDDAVVTRTEGTSYAQQLVTLAQRVSTAQAVPMLSMAGRSDLSVRVKALLDATLHRGRMTRRMQVGAVAVAGAIIATLSALRAEPGTSLTIPVATTPPAVADTSWRTSRLLDTLDKFTDRVEAQTEHLQDTVVDQLRGRPPRGSRVSRAIAEALIESAEQGDIEEVAALISGGVDVNTVLEGDGTALIAASRRGDLRMVRFLTEHGADVNLGVEGDGNPLIMASVNGHRTVVQFLLDRGGDANAAVEGDGSPLIAASQRRDLALVKLLVSGGANIEMAVQGDGNPLIAAATTGAVPVIEYLLDRGADIEAIVPGDENALISASANGQLSAVRLLVQHGANINAGVWAETTEQVGSTYQTIREYRTPLNMALKNGHQSVASFLRTNGAVN